MTVNTDSAATHERVTAIVDGVHTRDLVAAYFGPDGGFAGTMFDGLDAGGVLADNPSTRFTAADIAAASLLDVRFGPPAVRELLTSPDVASALEAVPTDIPLWMIDKELYDKANTLWSLVKALPGVGGTRTSKLLSRKRPHLIPIVDSVIAEALDLQHKNSWWTLAEILREDEDLRGRIDHLRPAGISEAISILRLLDVAVWMTCSRSTAAVMLQQELGATPSRVL